MSLFNHESYVWKPFSWLADLFLLSLVWLLCCVPLVTTGAATGALYDAVARGLRGKESFPLRRFWSSFKNGLGSMCITTLIWGLIYGFCGFLALQIIAPVRSTQLSYVLAWAGLLFLLLPFGIGLWLPPLHSRFTFSVAGLNSTGLKLALGKVHITLALAMSAVLTIWLSVRFVAPAFFLPAVLMLLWSCLLEPVFKGYET